VIFQKHIILASGSPRRSFMLSECNIPYTVNPSNIEEIVPEHIPLKEAPEYLAVEKANACDHDCGSNEIILAADTSVFLGNDILNKPADHQEAVAMISILSQSRHEVITGFCLKNNEKQISESVLSIVEFDAISDDEIEYYVNQYKPFDKAGSYGIQDWIGWCKINRIEGSYSNILGLPMREVYLALSDFD
jgi:septum formation protein